MTTHATVDQFVERAQQFQEGRMAAIRELALTRQRFLDEQATCAQELEQLKSDHAARLAEVERGDIRAYSAATGAGWTPDELRKIGFSEPAKKARARRRPARKPRSEAASADTHGADQRGDSESPQE